MPVGIKEIRSALTSSTKGSDRGSGSQEVGLIDKGKYSDHSGGIFDPINNSTLAVQPSHMFTFSKYQLTLKSFSTLLSMQLVLPQMMPYVLVSRPSAPPSLITTMDQLSSEFVFCGFETIQSSLCTAEHVFQPPLGFSLSNSTSIRIPMPLRPTENSSLFDSRAFQIHLDSAQSGFINPNAPAVIYHAPSSQFQNTCYRSTQSTLSSLSSEGELTLSFSIPDAASLNSLPSAKAQDQPVPGTLEHRRIVTFDSRCHRCGKKFIRLSLLNRHIASGACTKLHHCSHCPKSFHRLNLLKRHIRVHTGERPYTCKICGSSFAEKGNLTRHTRTHTSIKPFSCPICHIAFSRKSHMRDHHRACHPHTEPKADLQVACSPT